MKLQTGLIAGVLVLMSGVALANRPPQGMGGPRMDIDKLEILLDLDAYQKQEVQKILESQRAAMRAKREELRKSQTRPSREEMFAQREAAQKETRTQLEKILSEQQLKKFDVLTEHPPLRQRHAVKSDAAKKTDAVKTN
jgi:hypothetical protein